MKKRKFRPFWSYDVLKTEAWLNSMASKGWVLTKIHFSRRLFVFEKGEVRNTDLKIIYDKNAFGAPEMIKEDASFEEVLADKHYYVLNVLDSTSEYIPSHEKLLSRNQKIKYVVGLILLINIMMTMFPVLIITFAIIFGEGITFESTEVMESSPYTLGEIVVGIIQIFLYLFSLMIPTWMIYTYFKLGKSNKRLIKECGVNLDVKFTTPNNKISSKEEWKEMKKSNKLVRKIKIGWFYSPDKIEAWLEGMEKKGFNLLRMSKLGNSFYFEKGTPRNVKYHVDYQNKNDHDYFNINKESGWDLFFTSVTRFFAFSVWGQVYDEQMPTFYTDKETKIKHAKRLAISFTVWMIPMAILYIGLSILYFTSFTSFDELDFSSWLLFTPIMFLIVSLEYSIFTYRIIRYYFRIKKSVV
ncbi:MAG: DUF2812 domain-containing protein [Candidatus Izemoplasmataceae bacterium]